MARWRRAALACVVLGGVMLGSAACADSRPAPPAGSAAPTVQVSGMSIPYDGLQAWTSATIASRASTSLTVFAIGSESDGGGPCGPPVVRLHARETSTEVVVSVADYQARAAANTICSGVGHLASPYVVTLRRAIGDRKVVDASSGKRGTLVVSADYPDLPRPPKHLSAQVLRWDEDTHAVFRTWSTDEFGSVSLQIQPPVTTREFGWEARVVQQVAIRGVSATVATTGGGQYGQTIVQWTPNPRQTITLRLDNGSGRRWTTAEALALARSVVHYKVEATGRLPQPITPGTASAVYNSADGPVRHAPNLLKSSGVYVGLNCEGLGRVTVSLRGTVYPFDCTERLSRHVVKSVGQPNETFFLDVTATPGVRWAVTLARASLDGS